MRRGTVGTCTLYLADYRDVLPTLQTVLQQWWQTRPTATTTAEAEGETSG